MSDQRPPLSFEHVEAVMDEMRALRASIDAAMVTRKFPAQSVVAVKTQIDDVLDDRRYFDALNVDAEREKLLARAARLLDSSDRARRKRTASRLRDLDEVTAEIDGKGLDVYLRELRTEIDQAAQNARQGTGTLLF